MSSKVERERRKAQLLSQIQQQRLDLSASRREWLETTGAYDRRWNMLLSLRSWALVGSSVMAIWTLTITLRHVYDSLHRQQRR